MRAVVPLLTILAVVGVALIATSNRSGPHASRGPVRIRATSAGAVTPGDGERRDTIDTRATRTERAERPARVDSASKRHRGTTSRRPL